MSSPSRSKNQSSSKTSQFSSKSQYSSKTSQSSSSPLAVEGEPEVVRVGVVGSGLSGLSLAYLLSIQPWIMKESQIPPSSKKFHVVLFEKSPKLGMDSASFALPCACWKCSGDTTAGVGDLTSPPHTTAMVDVPMRSFFPGKVLPFFKPRLFSQDKNISILPSKNPNQWHGMHLTYAYIYICLSSHTHQHFIPQKNIFYKNITHMLLCSTIIFRFLILNQTIPCPLSLILT